MRLGGVGCTSGCRRKTPQDMAFSTWLGPIVVMLIGQNLPACRIPHHFNGSSLELQLNLTRSLDFHENTRSILGKTIVVVQNYHQMIWFLIAHMQITSFGFIWNLTVDCSISSKALLRNVQSVSGLMGFFPIFLPMLTFKLN